MVDYWGVGGQGEGFTGIQNIASGVKGLYKAQVNNRLRGFRLWFCDCWL